MSRAHTVGLECLNINLIRVLNARKKKFREKKALALIHSIGNSML